MTGNERTNGWSRHELYVEGELKRHSAELLAIHQILVLVQTELATFKARVYSVAGILGTAAAIIVKLIWQ